MRIRIVALLCATAVLGALAGCGSSSNGKSSAGSSSTASSAPKGKPIVIGVINDATRPDGLSAAYIPQAAEVRAEAINAAGGIKGRPVKVVACDTKGDPNTATACARTMVSDGAVAVVGMVTIYEAQIFPVLEQAGIPAVGTIPVSSVGLTAKDSFAFTPGIIATFLGGPGLLAQLGAKSPSLVYPSNIPNTSAALVKIWGVGVGSAKIKSGPIAGYALGTTNFNAAAVKAVGGGADGTFAFGSGPSQGPLIKAIQQQNSKLQIATLTETLTVKTLEYLGARADGVASVSFLSPATSDVPGVKMFNADVDKYQKDMNRTETAIMSWMGVWTLERLFKDMPTIDRPSVMAAMSKLTDFDEGGIVPPTTTTKKATDYPGMDRVYNATVVYSKVKDGKAYPIDGKFVNPFPGGK
jgi:ABC-type branched-subunit amino acid transport system substrate-binding protein